MAIAAQHTRFVTNDYVSPIPAEDLIKVAIKKQEMYDEGRKQIKQVYDNYGKLRSMIKNENELKYYDQEMQKLTKNVQENAGLDFANIGNVEAVINLSKPFENDDYIKTALENGQEIERRQKELNSMPKDKRSADNDLVYMYDAQKHMESGGLGEKIAKNKSYQQYIDIRAKIMEIEKSIPAEEFTEFADGPDGYLKQIEYKRKRREDIYRRAMEGMTPEEQAQLQIHAQANMLRLGSDVVYQNWVGYNKEEKLLADTKRKEAMRERERLRAVKKPTAAQLEDLRAIDNAIGVYEATINAANQNINMNPDEFDMGEYLPFFMKRQIDGIAGQLAFSNTKTELKENKIETAQFEHNLRLKEISARGAEERRNAQFKNDMENYAVDSGVGLASLKGVNRYVTNIDASKPPIEQIDAMISQINSLDPNNSKAKIRINQRQKQVYLEELKQLRNLYTRASSANQFDKVTLNRSAGLGQVQTSAADLLNRPVIDIINSGNTLDFMTRIPSKTSNNLTAEEKAQQKLAERVAELKAAGVDATTADKQARQEIKDKNKPKG